MTGTAAQIHNEANNNILTTNNIVSITFASYIFNLHISEASIRDY